MTELNVRKHRMFRPRCCCLRRLIFCAVLALVAGLLPFHIYAGQGDFPSSDKIQPGDVVFIRGKSIRSAVVSFFEGGYRAYSHVGLVVLENGQPFIIHADPAGGAMTDRVMREPWYAVISPKRIAAATIFRMEDSNLADGTGIQASAVAQKFWKDALPFDHEFDLTTPQKLYCTELVWRAYIAAGVDLLSNSFGLDRKYLLPSDLIKSGFLREVM